MFEHICEIYNFCVESKMMSHITRTFPGYDSQVLLSAGSPSSDTTGSSWPPDGSQRAGQPEEIERAALSLP